MAVPLLVTHYSVVVDIVHTAKLTPHANRPVHRRALDLQNVFYFVENLDGVSHFPVQLVDEGKNRRISQSTDLHQLYRALLNAFGAIDHHQG